METDPFPNLHPEMRTELNELARAIASNMQAQAKRRDYIEYFSNRYGITRNESKSAVDYIYRFASRHYLSYMISLYPAMAILTVIPSLINSAIGQISSLEAFLSAYISHLKISIPLVTLGFVYAFVRFAALRWITAFGPMLLVILFVLALILLPVVLLLVDQGYLPR